MDDQQQEAIAAKPGTCPNCGLPVVPSPAVDLCPACLLKQGLSPGTLPSEALSVAEVAQLFPQLEVLALLGRGGMGAVYKARQPALDRLVALKLLPRRAIEGPGLVERFHREARTLAKLNHPSILTVYDFGQADELPYFIMEYVDGPNLREVQKAGELSPAYALWLVPQICDALQFAHDKGVVHRDIKPENLLLDSNGRVKIADFGIAKIVAAGRQETRMTASQSIGTPNYMAPEQLEKPQEVDHRADIFSLGVLFYEMLTGELPLGKFASPSQRVKIDARLDQVVLRALEKQPERRYQQVREVKTDLAIIASTGALAESGTTGPSFPVSASAAGVRAIGWSPALAKAAVALLLLGVGYLVGRSSTGHSRDGAERAIGNGQEVLAALTRSAQSAKVEAVSESWRTEQVAALDGATGAMRASLPDVGVVELLAVSDATNSTRSWRPDGRLNAFHGALNELGGATNVPIPAYAIGPFRYRTIWFRGTGGEWSCEYKPGSAHWIGGGSSGSDTFDTRAFPESATNVTVRLGCLTGAWRLISTLDAENNVHNMPRRVGDPQFDPAFHASESGEGVIVTLQLNVDRRYCEARITAFTQNGIRYPNSGSAARSGSTTDYQAGFNGLALADVSEIRAEIRPVQWITFPDISLEPRGTPGGGAVE